MTNDTETTAPTASMRERMQNAENIRVNLARAQRDLLSARANFQQAIARMEDPETEDQTMHHADYSRMVLASLSLALGEVTRDEDRWRGYATARKERV